MKLQVKDVGEIELVSSLDGLSTIKATAREWTITLSDEEVSDLIVLMLQPVAKQSGISEVLFMAAMLNNGIEKHDYIKQKLPILAAVITEKRRLDKVGGLTL